MTLDLRFDDVQQAISAALAQFCRDRCSDEAVKRSEGRFQAELWKGLAELGVLALATPEGEGGALELAAASEALGAAVFPGPFPASVLAAQLLPEVERAELAAGAAVVSIGAPPLMPWAPVAGIFIELADGRAWRAFPRSPVEPVETLGGEPWGFVALERGGELGGLERATALYDLSLAAYLAAAGLRLVRATAEHGRTRKQFGRAIGEFQAVAHPLADCFTHLATSESLARRAACLFDAGDAGTGCAAAAARLAASRASLAAAYTCHQLFGAVGITLEGPVFRVSRRIRQLVSQPPGDSAERELLLRRFGL